MNNYIFVLGAEDPEMIAIQHVILETNNMFSIAAINGERVKPMNAYKAIKPIISNIYNDMTVVTVECAVEGLDPDIKIDHHNPDDFGYGFPPEKAWEGSCIGQVCNLLNWPKDRKINVEGKLWKPEVIAAADHCLTAAFAEKVPNVSYSDLVEYRDYTRTQYLIRQDKVNNLKEYKELLEIAKEKIKEAGILKDFPGVVYDLRPAYRKEGPIQGVNEIAARVGKAMMYELKAGGRLKVGLLGGTPTQISYFKDVWGPNNSLENIYGDPARGYAGGYLNKKETKND